MQLFFTELNILKFISIDLNNSVGITQNGHHCSYDVFEHLLKVIKLCSGEKL